MCESLFIIIIIIIITFHQLANQRKNLQMAQEAKDYIYSKNIPALLESLLAGLMYHKPDDPITFLEQCLAKAHNSTKNNYDWNLFHGVSERSPLTPDILSELTKSMTAIGDEPTTPSAEEKNQYVEDKEMMKRITVKPILFVLGGPGSGKGTQCSKIVEDFGFLHLSAGDLLRAEVAKGTEQGKELEATMKEGKLVPAEVTVGLLKAAMLGNLDSVGYLIDGFPRELDQGALFKEQVCDCTAVLMFDCTEEAMVERLLERGKTSGRVDDNEDTIRKRFHTFQEATLPVIEHYQQLDKVRKVDATRSVNEVYEDVRQILTELTTKQA